jgi:hypothetical protein
LAEKLADLFAYWLTPELVTVPPFQHAERKVIVQVMKSASRRSLILIETGRLNRPGFCGGSIL